MIRMFTEWRVRLSGLLLLSWLPFAATPAAAQNGYSLQPPDTLTADEDHRRMMELLGIEALRPGPSGDPNAPNAANTDEAKASPYTSLPDPLLLEIGERVTTPEVWWEKRRPEIVELFDREIFGRVPDDVPAIHWEVVSTAHEFQH